MRFNKLGRTGLWVSQICLGTATFGGGEGVWLDLGALGWNESQRLVGRALDAGVNFIDTADTYGQGAAEEFIGDILQSSEVKREDLVIASKVFGRVGTSPNSRGNSRGHIMDAVKGSLKRLKTDHIDLYQIHGFDAATPIEETVRALHTLVEQGHVRYVGVSNWAAWQIAKAIGISERLGLARFESLQAYYSIAGRDIEREIVPMLHSEGLGLLIWSPLAGGFLTGKYSDRNAGGRRKSFDFPPVDRMQAQRIIDVMRPIAEGRGVTVAAVAIAWLLRQEHVTSVIVGARTEAQLVDNISAVDVDLSAEEYKLLDDVSKINAQYPAWMFERQESYQFESLRIPQTASTILNKVPS